MIRFSLLLSFIVIIISGSLAQKVDSRLYSAADIPDSLKINAHSVKKFEKIVFQVTGPGKASYKVHQIITVLNTGGNNELFFIEYTDKFVSLADAEINLYDASGRLSRQAKKKDLGSESSGEGLVEDGKVFYLKVPSVVFPVTVEYKYELKFDGILNYPDYQVLKPNQSVMESSFEVLVPNSLG
ncbi:MAG TPA: DUF3857 domain-containing protein, partial [Parasegetibacter sp.]